MLFNGSFQSILRDWTASLDQLFQGETFDLTPHQVRGPIECQGANKSIANPKLMIGYKAGWLW